MNEAMDEIWKIEDYIDHPSYMINKAKLFNNHLATNLVSRAKEIGVLVNFAQMMEEILDMRSLFEGIEVAPSLQATQLE